MGVRLNRTAAVERGKADEAMQFAADVTSYINENWGIPIIWGMEVGGTFGKVHWFADYTDMAQLEETLGRTMTDKGYRKLLDDSADLFILGRPLHRRRDNRHAGLHDATELADGGGSCTAKAVTNVRPTRLEQ